MTVATRAELVDVVNSLECGKELVMTMGIVGGKS